jgi:Endoribonuclease L-PSP
MRAIGSPPATMPAIHHVTSTSRLPGGALPVLACRRRQRFRVWVRPNTCEAGGGPTEVVGDTMQKQTRQALRNVQTILEAAGSSLDRVVKVTVLIARPDCGNARVTGRT